MKLTLALLMHAVAMLLCLAASAADSPVPAVSGTHAAQAAEVTAYFQKTFWIPDREIYFKTDKDHSPDYVWRQAAAFSVLVAAARHEPETYRPIMSRFFHALDVYWDTKTPIPAYEPSPTKGNGHDKYYDDNEWLLITFMEAYELTKEPAYLARSKEIAAFVASGWDDKLGGGIWWHQSHKDGTKNTCANGPAAVGYLQLARLGPKNEAEDWVTAARQDVTWTREKLQAADGLYDDRIVVATGEVKRGKLTYNAALMLRAELALYRRTNQPDYLEHAKRIAKAADWFADKQTGVYRDPLKWSQFMVEADLDLYRTTGDAFLLERARKNGDSYYKAWKQNPPADMMSNAGTARILWLLAEAEAGRGAEDKSDSRAAH